MRRSEVGRLETLMSQGNLITNRRNKKMEYLKVSLKNLGDMDTIKMPYFTDEMLEASLLPNIDLSGVQEIEISSHMSNLIPESQITTVEHEEDGHKWRDYIYKWDGMLLADWNDIISVKDSEEDYFFNLYPEAIQKKIIKGKKLLKREEKVILEIRDYFKCAYKSHCRNLLKTAKVFWLGSRYSKKGLVDAVHSTKNKLERKLNELSFNLVVREHGIEQALNSFISWGGGNIDNYMLVKGEADFYREFASQVYRCANGIHSLFSRYNRDDMAEKFPQEYKRTSFAQLVADYLADYSTLVQNVKSQVQRANDYDRNNDMRLNVESICKDLRKKGLKSASEEFAVIVGAMNIQVCYKDGCMERPDKIGEELEGRFRQAKGW